jgi:hypothetical protein
VEIVAGVKLEVVEARRMKLVDTRVEAAEALVNLAAEVDASLLTVSVIGLSFAFNRRKYEWFNRCHRSVALGSAKHFHQFA